MTGRVRRALRAVAGFLWGNATAADAADVPPSANRRDPALVPDTNAGRAQASGAPVVLPAPTAQAPDYFISYTRPDREWAEWIAWQLEDAGYSVVLQAWDFRPGNNFIVMMDRASRARQTLIILSEAYLEADFTQPEWARAMALDPRGLQRRVIPVRVARCDAEGLLGPVIYVDLVELDRTAARRVLLDGVRPGRAKPTSEPPYPGGIDR